MLQQYLLKINKALSFVHLEMRRCMNQYDGQVYYGVVNTVSDEQSRLGTKYTVPQIAFYKAIVSIVACGCIFFAFAACENYYCSYELLL